MRSAMLVFLGSLVFLTGCIPAAKDAPRRYTPHDLSDAEKRQIKADLLVALNTPDALFSTVRAAISRSGQMTVCGWVRVRSEFPDYPRYPENRPFVVTYTYGGSRLRDFRLVRFAAAESEIPPLYVRCSDLGIPL